MAKEQMFDISKFYTKDNGEKGVPFEPVIDGEKVGIAFNVISYHSVKAARAVEDFGKEIDELKKITDPEEKKRREFDANAALATALVTGFSEGSRGPVCINGKALEYSDEACYAIMLNAVPIANAIIDFSIKNKNFLGRSV